MKHWSRSGRPFWTIGGNHRYAHLIGPRRERRPLPVTAYPYPKKDEDQGPAA
ncbi:hypothetical protein [Streptomyces sp.]|uniref:hypothetical protein n=1 Tax=Streptomyces sp. TaxID=1931 RepID=UPI002D782B4E|nr:hypothetical protein [Streptomyces sp.]HET6356196.1 hypothetical protein [Streptomyces sp.]